ncbi:MAG: coproporphyrinogen III oxidase, partial [Planctomycetota bacterium]|nr:coproporphyrinogen III oxidase [Planctomycetota bacterium]
ESVLMSLPPEVRWDYNIQPEADSEEAKLLEVLRNPRNWLGEQDSVDS